MATSTVSPEGRTLNTFMKLAGCMCERMTNPHGTYGSIEEMRKCAERRDTLRKSYNAGEPVEAISCPHQILPSKRQEY